MFGYILALVLILAAMATAVIIFALSGNNDGGKDDTPDGKRLSHADGNSGAGEA